MASGPAADVALTQRTGDSMGVLEDIQGIFTGPKASSVEDQGFRNARQQAGDRPMFVAQPGGFRPVDPSGRTIARTDYRASDDRFVITYADGSQEVQSPGDYLGKTAHGIREASKQYDALQQSQIGAPDVSQQAQGAALQGALNRGLAGGQIPRMGAQAALAGQTYLPTRGLSPQLGAALMAQQRAAGQVAAGRAGELGALESQRLALAGISDQRAQEQTLQGSLLDRAAANQGALTALATGQRQSAIAETERDTRRLGAMLEGGGAVAGGLLQYGAQADEDERKRQR